jgi:nitroreductase
MIELTNLVDQKYSIYPYKSYPVEDNTLNQVLETASLAATSDSLPPFLFVVVRTADKKATLRHIFDHDWFIQAPVVICACAIVPEAGNCSKAVKNHQAIDITPVANHLTLAAANENLGTCWFTGFNARRARQLLDLPAEVEPVACTPLGYPADQANAEECNRPSGLVSCEN